MRSRMDKAFTKDGMDEERAGVHKGTAFGTSIGRGTT
jgi:hypothetical protein